MTSDKDKRPKKTLVLTDEEWREYEKLKPMAHYDPETQANTFGSYVTALGTWAGKLRKKHKLEDDEAFFFHKREDPAEAGSP